MNKEIIYLDPNTIKTNRPNRQRSEINISDLLPSIKKNGVLVPIIIDKQFIGDHDINILVAGERRLECCKILNTEIPCIFKHNLTNYESQIIEFEENHKRKNLTWREEVKAIGKIFDLSQTQDPQPTKSQLSNDLSISEQKLEQILHIYKFLNEKILDYANNLTQATSLLHKFKSQKSEQLKTNISKILAAKPIPQYLKPIPPQPKKLNLDFSTEKEKEINNPIKNLDFKFWPCDSKFEFVHCDFGYNYPNYWILLNHLLHHKDQILAPQAHIFLWFKIDDYFEVKRLLDNHLITYLPRPLIWYKSNTKPNDLTNSPPKESYESALIINHNSRPYFRQIFDLYTSPRSTQPICPNQKSVSMLKYFFQSFVDKNTNVFDPTCGSGSALIAAEQLDCKSIFGLEINEQLVRKANEKIFREREIKQLITR